MGQGRQDDVVAYLYGKQSMEQLEAQNLEVHWHEYEMGHAVCLEEIDHIRQWLSEIL